MTRLDLKIPNLCDADRSRRGRGGGEGTEDFSTYTPDVEDEALGPKGKESWNPFLFTTVTVEKELRLFADFLSKCN